jgi:hypothetical protein
MVICKSVTDEEGFPDVGATIPMSETKKAKAWARLWPTVRPPHSRNLRAGAWYPVIKDDLEDRVSLWLYGQSVDVPRRFLEIRPRRPKKFTVVYRAGYQRPQGRLSKHHLGKRYGVCPICLHRFALFGEPERRECPNCGHEGEIAWWETG